MLQYPATQSLQGEPGPGNLASRQRPRCIREQLDAGHMSEAHLRALMEHGEFNLQEMRVRFPEHRPVVRRYLQ